MTDEKPLRKQLAETCALTWRVVNANPARIFPMLGYGVGRWLRIKDELTRQRIAAWVEEAKR